MKIGIVTISDRASKGEYEDVSGPSIERWLRGAVSTPFEIKRIIIADGAGNVRDALLGMCDFGDFDLILTSGGTGPTQRDQTLEGMQLVITKELPGFGELMRRVSLDQVPTAILSRQTAGIRGKTLIVNLPGHPDAIKVCLDAVFPAIPYCLDLIGADHIDTHPHNVMTYRPKRT